MASLLLPTLRALVATGAIMRWSPGSLRGSGAFRDGAGTLGNTSCSLTADKTLHMQPWRPGCILQLGGGTVGAAGTITVSGTVSIAGLIVNAANGGGLYTLSGGALALTQAATINDAVGCTIASPISGAFSVTKTGAGTTTLTGANSYTGGTTVPGGTLRAGAYFSAPGNRNFGSGTIVVQSGATLDINGIADIDNAITLSGTGVGGNGALVNNGAATSTANLQTPNITLAADASVGGTGNFYSIALGYAAHTIDLAGFNLTKTGTNTFTLSNTTLTAGTLTINAGVISQFNGGTTAGSTALVLGNIAGASFNLNANNATFGSLAGGGTTGGNVSLGGNTLTVGSLNTSTLYAGVISGTGRLTKNGTGALTLSGSNSYTGGTTINAGACTAGSIGAFGTGTITVNAGATLNKGGFALANTIINNGGTVNA